MTPRQQKEFVTKKYPKQVIDFTRDFCAKNNYELLYLTFLGEGDWRIMWKDSLGKADCEIFAF